MDTQQICYTGRLHPDVQLLSYPFWQKKYHVLCLHFKLAPFQIATYENCIPCLNPWNEFLIYLKPETSTPFGRSIPV